MRPTYAAPGVVCMFHKTPQNTTKHVAYVDCRLMKPNQTQWQRPGAMHTAPTDDAGYTGGDQ